MSYTVTMDDKLGMDASVSALKWTKEAPTKPGWYWAITLTALGHEQLCHVEVLRPRGRDLMAGFEGGFYNLATFTMWLGPLPEPQPPEA